jgi:hypothetical protein
VFTVIGVVRDEMHVNAFSDIWVPVTSQPSSDYKNQLFGGFMAMMMARSPEELPALKQEIIKRPRPCSMTTRTSSTHPHVGRLQAGPVRAHPAQRPDRGRRRRQAAGRHRHADAAVHGPARAQPDQPERRPHHGAQQRDRRAQGGATSRQLVASW